MSELNDKVIEQAPKKRGRKRKQDIIPPEDDSLNVAVSPDATSKRGRRRKQINYYDMANPGTFEVAINNDFTDLPVKSLPVVKPKIKTPPKVVNIEASVAKTVENEEKVDLNGTETISESNGVPNKKKSIDNIKGLKCNEEDGLNKKYSYTGQTVKMMKTLFQSFTPKKEEETSNNNVASEPVAENISSKRTKSTESPKTSASENVVCAVCNQSLDKTLWLHHKQRYHNNLAWRVGDEPMDLSDQSLVMYTLNALYKKKKPLYCDKCGEAKKSVVGFLSHQSICKKTNEQLESVKVACDLCGKKMLPVSMTTHMKFVHANKDKDDVPKKVKNESKPLPSKRSAAKKALKIIENVFKGDSDEGSHFSSDFNFETQKFAVDLLAQQLAEKEIIECPFKCNFETNELTEIYAHCKECPNKPSTGFVCKICMYIENKLEEMIFHVESIHNLTVNVNDEEDDCETDNQGIPKFLETIMRKSEKSLASFAYQWTVEFQAKYYSDLLFFNFIPKLSDWPILQPSDARDYLPKLAQSCDIAQLSINSFINPLDREYDFKKFKLFETQIHDDKKITIFCGGPVVSMAWVPIPSTVEQADQILAVSILQSPDEKCSTTKKFQSSAIQFWNFGPLLNKTGPECHPKLIFNLAHDYGPIWHMEWCPSGCYNKDDNRMGLLAVSGSDSIVYIYSIPFLDEAVGLYYKPKPILQLLLQRPNNRLFGGAEYYAVRTSWTKARGHNYISVGYTNGKIAIFNLKTQSILLKFKNQAGLQCLLPEKNFQAHSHSITILQLYHLNEGCRWLLTGSVDRSICVWDLQDPNYPIFTTRKNIVTVGLWLTHWLCFTNGSDEASTLLYLSTGLKQIRDYISDCPLSLTISPSTILSITGSDWLNAVMHGNSAGEIVAVFANQLLLVQPHVRFWKKMRLLFGYNYLIDKTKTQQERMQNDKNLKKIIHSNIGTQSTWKKLSNKGLKQSSDTQNLICDEPLVYDEAQKRYGLLFCDNKLESYADFPDCLANQLSMSSKSFTLTKANQYPLTAINQILLNPNQQSSLYYATGYQAGFVRISWMQFLKGDQQIH